MPELLPDEIEVFDLGREINIPSRLVAGQFCFHKCIWFLTGSIPDLQDLPPYEPYIRQHLAELKSNGALLWEDPPFEATSVEALKPLEILLSFPKDIYLIHLYDRILHLGHWVVLTETGVFDPGANRIEIPVDKWISLFQRRYSLRRVLPISRR
jgi:hypothetical protein